MKIGIVGLGHRMAHLARSFAREMPEAEFVAVADPHPDRMDVLTDLGAAPRRHDDAGEMIGTHRLDMLMVGSPNHLHLEHLRAALASDVPHIFAEKPLVISEEETLELARLIAAHDGRARVIVGLVLRYSPLYRILRKAQADGHIGEVMSIEATEHIAPYHGSFFARDWRRETRLSGGFMLEKCCHDVDLYQGVVGARAMRIASFGGAKKWIAERRPETMPGYVSAMAPRWGGTDDPWSGTGDIIDHQVALVEYATGATMAFHTNTNVPDEYRRFAVIGTDGMAEGDFIRNHFRVTLESGERVVDVPSLDLGSDDGHYGADGAMARDIAAHVRGGAPLPLSALDAMEAGVTALAMDRARAESCVVDLSEFWDRYDEALA